MSGGRIEPKMILDLCGGTGAWSKPYAEAGYDVRLITSPEYDVRLYGPPKRTHGILAASIHGILAAPPCTHLAGSGARWWKEKGDAALLEALSIVDACLRIILISKPKWWALENPVGRLVNYLGEPRMYFNPCDYGDPWTKRTALWGDFKMPFNNPVEPEPRSRIWTMPPGPDRPKLRSITPPGFAKAFFEANP